MQLFTDFYNYTVGNQEEPPEPQREKLKKVKKQKHSDTNQNNNRSPKRRTSSEASQSQSQRPSYTSSSSTQGVPLQLASSLSKKHQSTRETSNTGAVNSANTNTGTVVRQLPQQQPNIPVAPRTSQQQQPQVHSDRTAPKKTQQPSQPSQQTQQSQKVSASKQPVQQAQPVSSVDQNQKTRNTGASSASTSTSTASTSASTTRTSTNTNTSTSNTSQQQSAMFGGGSYGAQQSRGGQQNTRASYRKIDERHIDGFFKCYASKENPSEINPEGTEKLCGILKTHIIF